MTDPQTYHFTINQKSPNDGKGPEYVEIKDITKHPSFAGESFPSELSSERFKNNNNIKLEETIDTIVIHATAGHKTIHAVNTWINDWEDKKIETSAHWIVPTEGEPGYGEHIWAIVDEEKTAFHVKNDASGKNCLGAGSSTRVNHRSLGIEIVNPQVEETPFSEWQVSTTASIVLYAWEKYPNLKHVISHAKLDPVNRTDPGKNFPWDDFKEMVCRGINSRWGISAPISDAPISDIA